MRKATKRRSHEKDDNGDTITGGNDKDISSARTASIRKEVTEALKDTNAGNETGSNTMQQHQSKNNATTTAAAIQLLNLKPLRDLAQNFDIDIASCLNDYLTELDQVVLSTASSISPSLSPTDNEYSNSSNITNSNNTLLPNFAQAALLLQNSSGVYGRKVEYLHTLVYQSLHKLIEQVNQNSKSSSKRSSSASKSKNHKKHVDEDIFNFREYDPELDFLLLDDVLPIDEDGKRINMKQREKSGGIMDLGANGGVLTESTTTSSNGTDNNTTVLNTTRLSIGVIIDDQSDSKGAASDAAGNSMNSTLRLMNGACHIHSGTGALLMPGTTATMEMMATRIHAMPQKHSSDPGTIVGENSDGVLPMDTSIEKEGANVESNNEMEESNRDEVVFDNHCDFDGNDDDDDDDDDGGVGFVLNEIQSLNGDISQHESPTNNREESPTTPDIKDPWKMMLNPHDNTKSKIRPMKFGKTIRLPQDCDEMPSDSVTGTRSKISKKRKKKTDSFTNIKEQQNNEEEKHQWWNKCIATHSYNAAIALVKEEIIRRKTIESNNIADDDSNQDIVPVKTNRHSIMHAIPLKGHLFCNEFQYIAKEQIAQKALEKRQKKFENIGDHDKEIDMVCDSAAAAITNERFKDMYEEDDHHYEEDDKDGYIDFDGGAEYGDDDGDDNEIGDNNKYNNSIHAHLGENPTLHDFDQVFATSDDDDSGNELGTFEELCRAHLKEFAKGAAKYAVETDLTKRVSSWQSKLAAILEEEESRCEFNIGTYNNRTIKAIKKGTEKEKRHGGSKMGKKINFASITRHQEPFEVSRTFLTSLMLCNSENIEFCENGDNGVSHPDKLQLQLLNLEIESPMETYLAPSMLECIKN